MSTATTEHSRQLARKRQARRRARLREECTGLATRHCLACLHPFQPKRADSWLCSRRCVERLSFHRKQAQRVLTSTVLGQVRRHLLAQRQGVELAVVEEAYRRSGRGAELGDTAAIRDWWRSDRCQDRTDAVARYRLWFPDLCGISPAEAGVERLEFQRLAAAAWAAVELEDAREAW